MFAGRFGLFHPGILGPARLINEFFKSITSRELINIIQLTIVCMKHPDGYVASAYSHLPIPQCLVLVWLKTEYGAHEELSHVLFRMKQFKYTWRNLFWNIRSDGFPLS